MEISEMTHMEFVKELKIQIIKELNELKRLMDIYPHKAKSFLKIAQDTTKNFKKYYKEKENET